jgi:hypothetical protein
LRALCSQFVPFYLCCLFAVLASMSSRSDVERGFFLGCGGESGFMEWGFFILLLEFVFLLRSSVEFGPAARKDLDAMFGLSLLFSFHSHFLPFFSFFSFCDCTLFFILPVCIGLPIILSPYRTYPCLFTFHSYRCLLFPPFLRSAHTSPWWKRAYGLLCKGMFRWGGKGAVEGFSRGAMASCCKYTRT